MRACLFAACAALLLATTGCHGINLAKGHGDCCNCGGHGHGGAYAGGNHGGHGGQGGYAACPPGGYADGSGGYAACPPGGYADGSGGYGGHGGGGYGYGYGPGPGGGHVATHGTPGFPHHDHHRHREYVGPQGPPTAQVGYPYYTIRGPRDFLLDNPPSIGR